MAAGRTPTFAVNVIVKLVPIFRRHRTAIIATYAIFLSLLIVAGCFVDFSRLL